MNTIIYISVILHVRYIPFKHKFKYKVPSIFVDIDELKILKKKFLFFSVNSFNIFSFYEKDHGYRDSRSIKDYVEFYLNKYNIEFKKIEIKILCFPRILGYVFDPLSIIYCYDNNELIAIFYEVKNTSKEQHTYVFSGKSKNKNHLLNHQCPKQFYVSPFVQMQGYYKFVNKFEKSEIFIKVDFYNKNDQKVMMASQVGKYKKFNSLIFFKYLLFNPMLGFKVILLILFEAFRIFFKGGKYYGRKKKVIDTITFEGNF